MTRVIGLIIGIPLGLMGLGMLLAGIGTSLTDDKQQLSNDIGMAFVGVMMIVGGVALIWMYSRTKNQRTTPIDHYRLSLFAAANGMSYSPGPYLATNLTPWYKRAVRLQVSRVLRRRTQPYVEYGNFEERLPDIDQRGVNFGGYAAIQLKTNLPNILLLSRRNNSSGDLWRAIPPQTEKLSLEGDFDKYFTLYAPSGYATDALYLFTPDLMVNLMDKAAAYDVEIIDDWVFLTSRRYVTADPAEWTMMTGAVAAITAKFAQWDRWRDDRSTTSAKSNRTTNEDVATASNSTAAANFAQQPPVNTVAPQGRRLRLAVPKGNALIMGLGVALVALMLLLPGGVTHRGSANTRPSATATATPALGTTPAWANPATTAGTKLTVFGTGDVRIDAYQVATFQSASGTMVLINYVLTNEGPPLLVNASVDCFSFNEQSYEWPTGVTYAAPESVFQTYGVNAYAVRPGGPKSGVFATGDAVSEAKAIPYSAGTQYVLTVRIAVADGQPTIPLAEGNVSLKG